MMWFSKTNAAIVFLAVAATGMLIGSIRIKRVGLSVAGVLCVALLCGVFFPNFAENHAEVHSFCTKTGISLFVPCVALEAGQELVSVKKTKAVKAFLSGAAVVSIGGFSVWFCSRFTELDSGLLAGLFAGSLTSTPALATATELFGKNSAVGYGISYCFGLLLIVVFVQLLRKKEWDGPETTVRAHGKTADPIPVIFAVGLFGNLLNRFCRISVTTGILIFGMLLGVLLSKTKGKLPDLTQIRTLGLILFFFGTGLSAGGGWKDAIRWESLAVGIGISVCAVCVGYLVLRFLLRFCRADALTVLCGGMTSTPAVSVLKPDSERMPLYTIAYTGALCALLIWVRLFYIFAERGW